MSANLTRKEIGNLGEDIAEKFLKRKGYEILERNYTKKWGEIDIIAAKNNIVYFVEVKSVARETIKDFSRETYDPEDNMYARKIQRLHRALQTYLLENDIENDWELVLVTVRMGLQDRIARCELIEDLL